MKPSCVLLTCVVMVCAVFVNQAGAAPVDLKSASSFAVLGASTVTNTGQTSLIGDIGVFPGTAITGFFGTNENEGPGIFSGSSYQGDAVAQQAQADALQAYNDLAGMEITHPVLTGQDLGGLTLSPGVYKFDAAAALTGTLTLDGAGDYVFQIGTTLTTSSGSSVVSINGADLFNDVFWQVGSSATLGINTAFGGTIIADQSVTLDTKASVNGRVIGLNAAVTLDSNHIVIPEPSSILLLALGGLAMISRRRRMA